MVFEQKLESTANRNEELKISQNYKYQNYKHQNYKHQTKYKIKINNKTNVK
jgi:hypothetical protein